MVTWAGSPAAGDNCNSRAVFSCRTYVQTTRSQRHYKTGARAFSVAQAPGAKGWLGGEAETLGCSFVFIGELEGRRTALAPAGATWAPQQPEGWPAGQEGRKTRRKGGHSRRPRPRKSPLRLPLALPLSLPLAPPLPAPFFFTFSLPFPFLFAPQPARELSACEALDGRVHV